MSEFFADEEMKRFYRLAPGPDARAFARERYRDRLRRQRDLDEEKLSEGGSKSPDKRPGVTGPPQSSDDGDGAGGKTKKEAMEAAHRERQAREAEKRAAQASAKDDEDENEKKREQERRNRRKKEGTPLHPDDWGGTNGGPGSPFYTGPGPIGVAPWIIPRGDGDSGSGASREDEFDLGVAPWIHPRGPDAEDGGGPISVPDIGNAPWILTEPDQEDDDGPDNPIIREPPTRL